MASSDPCVFVHEIMGILGGSYGAELRICLAQIPFEKSEGIELPLLMLNLTNLVCTKDIWSPSFSKAL